MAGTTAAQRSVTGTLETIAGRAAQAGLVSPAIFYVGEVAALSDRLNWFKPAAIPAAYNAHTSGAHP
jgi:siroheme synthase